MLKYCPARLHWKLPWRIWKRQVAKTVRQEVSDGKSFKDLASTDLDLQCQTWTYLKHLKTKREQWDQHWPVWIILRYTSHSVQVEREAVAGHWRRWRGPLNCESNASPAWAALFGEDPQRGGGPQPWPSMRRTLVGNLSYLKVGYEVVLCEFNWTHHGLRDLYKREEWKMRWVLGLGCFRQRFTSKQKVTPQINLDHAREEERSEECSFGNPNRAVRSFGNQYRAVRRKCYQRFQARRHLVSTNFRRTVKMVQWCLFHIREVE